MTESSQHDDGQQCSARDMTYLALVGMRDNSSQSLELGEATSMTESMVRVGHHAVVYPMNKMVGPGDKLSQGTAAWVARAEVYRTEVHA